jgi:hypothetical protein
VSRNAVPDEPPNSGLQADGRRQKWMERQGPRPRTVIVCGRREAAVSLVGNSTRLQLKPWYVGQTRYRCKREDPFRRARGR